MTFISLRKHNSNPGPGPESDDEPGQEPEDENTAENLPTSWAGAALIGICGPAQWLARRFGTGVAWGTHIFGLWALGYYGGWVAAGITLVWLLAATAFVPREHLERLATAIERLDTPPPQTAPKTDPEDAEEPPPDPIVTILWQLIADAPGVHLKTLTEHLQAAAPSQAIDRAAVRTKLAALQIPTRASVRDAANRVNEGVHRDDLTAWQQPPSPADPAPLPDPRSGPVATALTSDVADTAPAVATPLSRLRGLFSKGGA